jgi:hypothetical protein
MTDKKLLLLVFVLLVFPQINILFAQSSFSMSNDSSGIYFTYRDFETGALINAFLPFQKNHSIWPQGFFKYKGIELKTPDTTMVCKRSEIWGYTDHKGRLIRIFNKHHYKVLCDKGIIIYIIYSPTKITYHFSRTLNEPIYQLTIKNLSTVYSDNPDFINRISSLKKKLWLTWDDKKERFLINELYLIDYEAVCNPWHRFQ